jgi:CrcB protein
VSDQPRSTGGPHPTTSDVGANELLPLDPDVDAVEDARQRGRSSFAQSRRSRWPKLRADVIGVVFAGGCAGGAARYAATSGWAAPTGGFPWATFAVNVTGAFILGLVVIIAADVVPSRYLRPLLGTGFCGGLTTFSSVVVATDQLFAHGHARTAVSYLLATIAAGLAACSLGLLLGRAIAANRRRTHLTSHARRERSSP